MYIFPCLIHAFYTAFRLNFALFGLASFNFYAAIIIIIIIIVA